MQENQEKILRKSIVLTLAYYQATESPLTLAQIGRYLLFFRKVPSFSLANLKQTLAKFEKKGIVTRQKGLYCLTEKKDGLKKKIWCSFLRREKESQRKIDKVRKALYVFSLIPFIKNIYLCGSVARKSALPKSDVDFLVITNNQRVWFVRFFLTIISFFLGKKTSSSSGRNNKFCLNHYRSEFCQTIPQKMQDTYSASEYSRMLNLFGQQGRKNFLSSNQTWMKNFLPNFDYVKPPLFRFPRSNGAKHLLEVLFSGRIGNFIEAFLQRIQKMKITKNIHHHGLPQNARLVLENNVIMFHLTPRAPKVMGRMRKTLDELSPTYN